MSPIDDFSVQPIEQRLETLAKRQSHLMIWFFLSMTFAIAIGVSLFFQKEMIYRFFDLSTHVQVLDLPYHVQDLIPFKEPIDYFFNLLSWVGWLFVKVFGVLIGAFLLVYWAKKLRFFQRRFQSWTQRFVAWLIAFILMWSGLSYLQYDWSDDTEQAYQQWMSYRTNIIESQIAQDLQRTNISPTEKAYVLAQVALLHPSVDRKTANVYVNQLVEAEKNNPIQFNQYDFQPEQLWVMQQQLYGRSVTATTQALDTRAQQAQQFSRIVNVILWGMIALVLGLSGILYTLAKHLKNRRDRITHKLDV